MAAGASLKAMPAGRGIQVGGAAFEVNATCSRGRSSCCSCCCCCFSCCCCCCCHRCRCHCCRCGCHCGCCRHCSSSFRFSSRSTSLYRYVPPRPGVDSAAAVGQRTRRASGTVYARIGLAPSPRSATVTSGGSSSRSKSRADPNLGGNLGGSSSHEVSESRSTSGAKPPKAPLSACRGIRGSPLRLLSPPPPIAAGNCPREEPPALALAQARRAAAALAAAAARGGIEGGRRKKESSWSVAENADSKSCSFKSSPSCAPWSSSSSSITSPSSTSKSPVPVGLSE